MAFHPYVFFSGNCAEAFARYHEIFGGDVAVMTMNDLPPGVDPMPGSEPHHVMHAALNLADGVLMGSDDPSGDGGPKAGLAVSYTTPDEAEGKRVLEGLAEGGELTMPYGPTFYAQGFGMCIDRFGVTWMVSGGDPVEIG
jgi:PhnB protein